MNELKFPNIGETLYSETLPNGLTVLISPKPGFSRSFAFFATNYGGAMRRFSLGGRMIDTPAGVAHFLEHKMFDTPDGNALAALSASGASPNAYTSSGMTAYYFESTSEFDKNLRTLLSFVSQPYFTDESVKKEQGIIGQEIRMIEDNPGTQVYFNLMKCLYAHHPARDSVAGTVESIAEITAQTLYDCHAAFYAPSNMVLCVAGDQDPEAVVRAALEILPAERAPVPEPDYGPAESEKPAERSASAAMEVSAPQFMMGVKVRCAEQGGALLRQRLTGALAIRCVAGRASPFYTGLYSEGLLKNDFGAELDYAAGTASFIAGGESAQPETVAERFLAQAARIADEGPGDDFFERARRAAYGSRLRALESFDDLCPLLAEGCFGGFMPLDAFEVLGTITAAECRDFIREYFTPERLTLSVITPSGLKG